MLNAYCLDQGRVTPLDEEAILEVLATAQWIELAAPSDEELLIVQSLCPLALPELEDINELEASAHHATYDLGFQVNSLFFHQLGDEPQNTNISFVFDGQRLVSICSRELPHTRLLRIRNQRGLAPLPDALSVLLSLLEIKVDGLADEMEQVYRDLESISRMVLGRQSRELEEAVDGLAEQEDMIGKVRLCLMDGQRDIRFLVRQPILPKKYRKRGIDMLGDIDTLLPHNAFLSEKADFLLNTAQGFINIEQNRIMKVFSIAAVVFLPPTLVAGVYGMNFHLMPELSWPWGYPMALGLMTAAGVSPYLYFKLKGWL